MKITTYCSNLDCDRAFCDGIICRPFSNKRFTNFNDSDEIKLRFLDVEGNDIIDTLKKKKNERHYEHKRNKR